MRKTIPVCFVPLEIDLYAASHSAKELPILKKLYKETKKMFPEDWDMMIGRQEAALLQFLILAIGVKRIVEIGTFTGYSAIAMASVLPSFGRIITLDENPETNKIAKGFIRKAGMNKKIKLFQGDAHFNLKQLPVGGFDMAFIDADKEGYADYWQQCKKLVRQGGIIIADNTLRKSGNILNPADVPTRAIDVFNKMVAKDKEVHAVLTTIRDGITLAYKR